jgi:hypothetical protein
MPVLFLVAEDRAVLDALAADLGRRFGADHEIVAERTPAAALAALRQLGTRSQAVAVLLAAQRMAGMNGVDRDVVPREAPSTAPTSASRSTGRDADTFKMRAERCFFNDFFARHGNPLLTTAVCAWDANWMRAVDPVVSGLRAERTSLMSLGDDACRFRVVRTGDPLAPYTDALDQRFNDGQATG